MSDLCNITSSKRIFAADYQAEGVPFYRGKEITEKYNGAIEVSTELFIARSKFEAIKANSGAPLPGDLLLTSVGTLGSTYVVRRGDEFYFKDGNITWFRAFDGLDSNYFNYWLTAPDGRAELKKCTIGSSQSAYTIVLLKDMEIELPSLSEQRCIASILSAYDDLIENNTRRIAILEEMARRIYEEWFVRFRFPGHEGRRMVESALGLVPEGWSLRPLGNFGEVVTGKTPSKANPAFYGGDVPFLKTPDMHGNMFILATGESLSVDGAASQRNKTIPVGSLCVSCIGTIGVVSITARPCHTNQQINALVPADRAALEFLYYRLKDSKKTLENLGANGTTMSNVNKSKFDALALLAPPQELLNEFHVLVAPMFALIEKRSRTNLNLRTTRDLLLPKLISGELDVSAFPEPEVLAA